MRELGTEEVGGRRYGRILAVALALALLGLAASVSPAAAQLRLIPQAGLYAPVTDLGTVSSGGDAVDVGKRSSSFAWGAGLELGGGDGTGLRVTGLYGTDGEVPVEGVGCDPATCRSRSTVLALSGAVVLRPLPTLVVVRPYLVLGGGLKRYDFEVENGDDVREAFEDGSKGTAHLGAGLEVNLGGLRGTVEVTDFASGAALEGADGTQHDFFVTVGLVIG